MTAHAMKGDRERCLEAGMDAYISKPIQADEIFRTVESLVARHAPPEEGGEGKRPGANGLDLASLAVRFGGDAKLLRRLVDVFLDDCPRMVARIRKAVATRNAEALAKVAHGFKGAVSNFGATEVVEMARRLEAMGRQGDLNGTDEICQRLERAIPALAEALQAVSSRPARRSKRPEAVKEPATVTTEASRHRETQK